MQDWSTKIVIEVSGPRGWHRARLDTMEPICVSGRPTVVFLFVIVDAKFSGCWASGTASLPPVLRPHHKLYKWASVLLGRSLQSGEVLNAKLIVGRESWIMIEPEDRGVHGRFNKVTDVRKTPAAAETPPNKRPGERQVGHSRN